MYIYMFFNCQEMIFADLTGTGAQSLLCTGYDAYGPPVHYLCVFKDNDNPRPCPPRHLTGSWLSNHPHLEWVINTEDDIDEYNVYRSISEFDTWELIATVSHPTNSYTDPEIWYNPHGYNCKVSYVVKAVDLADNESLGSNSVRFAGWIIKPGSIGEDEGSLSISKPDEFSLSASPNPFNPATTLTFDLSESGIVEMAVYNAAGQRAATLVNGYRDTGRHQVTWDASRLPAGIYLVALQSSGSQHVQKVLLLK